MGKRKRQTDLATKVLEKSKQYSNVPEETDQQEPDEIPLENKKLRKSTESDKLRKKEKRKKKLQLKQQSIDSTSDDSTLLQSKTLALEYLHLWSQSRAQWAFKKTRQIWLLQNIYNLSAVSDEDFEVLLEHFSGLQGLARSRLIQTSENMVCAYEHQQNQSNDETPDEDSALKIFHRARNVLQTLV